MWKRIIEAQIDKYLTSSENKILFIWGPRRSGKTTLLTKISEKLHLPIFNFDLISEREFFQPKREILEKLASEHQIILIDEIQNYPEATLSLKVLHDEFKVKIIATGSSELRQKSKDFDSLAGRYKEIFCLPFSSEEAILNTKVEEYKKEDSYRQIATRFQTFGAYPEIYLTEITEKEKIELLRRLFEAYVLKDIINIYNLKNTKLAIDILTKIALQLGQEVSLREIASSLSANVTTVASYIEIFIKNYILIPLPSFKTNLRRSVSENRKLYFYDLGLRNILVKDFRPLELRPDRGGLFENFVLLELEKRKKIYTLPYTFYFYREYGGREIDIIIEDYQKKYTCVEVKLGQDTVKKIFPLPHRLTKITPDNYYQQIDEILKADV